MSSEKPSSKLTWSKLLVPPELADLLFVVASKKGYKREDVHRFLYHLLKTTYPEDVEKLTDYMETRWLDRTDSQ